MPAPTEGATKNTGEGFHYEKFSQCKTSRNLKIGVLEIPNNKHIGELFSKYELLFLDQANSSSDPSQILILQFPVPRAFLAPLPFLSNFALAQPSSCSSSVSLFSPNQFDHMPTQGLDISNHVASQANQIYH